MRVWPHAGDACKALNGFRVGRGFWALRPLAPSLMLPNTCNRPIPSPTDQG